MSASGGTNGFMEKALEQARAAQRRGEVPVGAVLVDIEAKQILAADGNRVIERHDPTAHAEMLVIRAACARRENERLSDCALYVTLEPCAMCAQAISLARISRLYFAAEDPKGGGVDHGPRLFSQPTCHHRPEVYSGIGQRPAAELLRDFFAVKR